MPFISIPGRFWGSFGLSSDQNFWSTAMEFLRVSLAISESFFGLRYRKKSKEDISPDPKTLSNSWIMVIKLREAECWIKSSSLNSREKPGNFYGRFWLVRGSFVFKYRKKSDYPMASDSKKFKENSRIFLRFGRKSQGAFEGVSGRFWAFLSKAPKEIQGESRGAFKGALGPFWVFFA